MNKLIALAVVALMGSATLASAQNSFTSVNQRQNRDSMVELGTITTDGPGKVMIFSIEDGIPTGLLGWTDLKAGGNLDVKVPIEHGNNRVALAVLVVNDKPVATEQIDFIAE